MLPVVLSLLAACSPADRPPLDAAPLSDGDGWAEVDTGAGDTGAEDTGGVEPVAPFTFTPAGHDFGAVYLRCAVEVVVVVQSEDGWSSDYVDSTFSITQTTNDPASADLVVEPDGWEPPMSVHPNDGRGALFVARFHPTSEGARSVVLTATIEQDGEPVEWSAEFFGEGVRWDEGATGREFDASTDCG